MTDPRSKVIAGNAGAPAICWRPWDDESGHHRCGSGMEGHDPPCRCCCGAELATVFSSRTACSTAASGDLAKDSGTAHGVTLLRSAYGTVASCSCGWERTYRGARAASVGWAIHMTEVARD